jgi:hypothetical protein
MPHTLSEQLNTDPRFLASTGWSNAGEGYPWAIEGDGAAYQRLEEDQGITLRNFAGVLEGERQFLTILHIDERTSGNVKVIVGNAGGTIRAAPGTYAEIITATDAGACGLWTNFSGDLRALLLEVYELIG